MKKSRGYNHTIIGYVYGIVGIEYTLASCTKVIAGLRELTEIATRRMRMI
jgi:hypothetical protein